ncbi:MAG: hypothetical protein PHW03_03145 [Eubacteriales bacterium]|nr:hypothetical protein [Eubacteriales bacterium]MDD4389781.1 hypothetical protein [Eubacteriales bacterium]
MNIKEYRFITTFIIVVSFLLAIVMFAFSFMDDITKTQWLAFRISEILNTLIVGLALRLLIVYGNQKF